MEREALVYELALPRHIVFGWGRHREVGTWGARLGRRATLVCGSRTLIERGWVERIENLLREAGVEMLPPATLDHEPEVADVDQLTDQMRRNGAGEGDFLVAVGGGAAIDLAKAVSAMAVQSQSASVKDFLEGVGRGLKLDETPLPMLAMPTTAGTGTEATKNAVISSYDPPFKKSLRDARMIPRVALVDPELTASTPPAITAASGMDAITQLFESYVTRKRQPITSALARHGLEMSLGAIPRAVEDGRCRQARERMAHAAMLSGICLANAGLGMAHGVAPALGVHARVPHGAACALMLPTTLKTNAEVCGPEYAELARRLLALDPNVPQREAVERLIDRVEEICRKIGVPRRLSEVGVSREQIPDLVAGSRGNSMRGNPRELTDEELTRILESIA